MGNNNNNNNNNNSNNSNNNTNTNTNNSNSNNNNNNNNNNHFTHCVTAFYFSQDDPPQGLDYTPFRGWSRDPSLCCPQSPQPNPIRSRNIIHMASRHRRIPPGVLHIRAVIILER